MKYKVVILASSRDLRRCSLSSSVATCLWPVSGVPVIERLLGSLSAQGVSDAVVCSNGCSAVIERTIDKSKCPNLTFLDEPFPVGSAGCVRDAVNGDASESLLVVFQGSMVSPPRIDELLAAHKEGGSDLTVFFEPEQLPATSSQLPAKKQLSEEKQRTDERKEKLETGNWKLEANKCVQGAGIYVCSSSVLKHIPEIGYFDIKESLIPALLAAGKKVHHATLSAKVNNFRNRREYLAAAASVFDGSGIDGLRKLGGSGDVWLGKDVEIAEDARIVGPVAVLDGAKIASGSVVLGPAVIGRNVVIGSGSVIVNSILWDRASIGSGCHISGSVVASNTTVEDNAVLEDTAVAKKGGGTLERIMRKICQRPVAG